MIRKYIPKNIEELADWYMRYISPLALVGGFVLDSLVLLKRVDLWASNALLLFYLAVAAVCIALFNWIESGRLRYKWTLAALPLLPVVAQFAFGALLSGYLSLYSRSAAYSVSWIFVFLLAAVVLLNERFYKYYRNFSVQVSVYFSVLFSFFIFFLPVVFREIGPYMFLASGLASIVVIALFLMLLYKIVPEVVRRDRRVVLRSLVGIFVAFNLLYFTGAIPPLPLALKDAGVYHNVVRSSAGYTLTTEPLLWYQAYLRYNTTYHKLPGESVYAWSAIFAPSGLRTTIFHEWQRYNETTREWVTTNTFSYPITGGRDGGYRGYSVKDDAGEGSWRVRVMTRYGQIIGVIKFEIVEVSIPPELEEQVQ